MLKNKPHTNYLFLSVKGFAKFSQKVANWPCANSGRQRRLHRMESLSLILSFRCMLQTSKPIIPAWRFGSKDCTVSLFFLPVRPIISSRNFFRRFLIWKRQRVNIRKHGNIGKHSVLYPILLDYGCNMLKHKTQHKTRDLPVLSHMVIPTVFPYHHEVEDKCMYE